MRLALWTALWIVGPLAHVNGLFRRNSHDIKELLLAGLMLGLIAPLAWKGPWPRARTLPGILLLAFVSSLFVSTLTSQYQAEAFFKTILDLILIAWGLWWLMQPDRDRLFGFAVTTLFGVTLLVCLIGSRALLGEESGQNSTIWPIGHRYYWAEFLMAAIPLLLLHPFRRRFWWPSLIVVLPALGVLVLLGRRMPLVGLLLGGSVAALLFGWQWFRRESDAAARKKALTPVIAGAAGVFLIVLGFAFQGDDPTRLAPRLEKALDAFREGDFRRIDRVRMPVYRSVPAAIASQPLGYGRGSYPLQFFELTTEQSVPPWTPKEIPSYHPYNTFFHLAVEGGVLAALAFLVFFLWLIVGLVRRLTSGGASERPTDDAMGYVLLAGLIAFGVDSLTFSSFEFPLTRLMMCFYLMCTVTWIHASRTTPSASDRNQPGETRRPHSRFNRYNGLVMIVVCAGGLVPYYLANGFRESAGRALNQATPEAGLSSIRRALSLNPAPRHFVLTAMQLHVANEELDEAIALLEKYLDQHPHDALVRVELAKAYAQRGDESSLAAHKSQLERTLEYWPASPYALERLGDLARKAGDMQRAAKLYQTFFDFYPSIKDTKAKDRYEKISDKLQYCLTQGG